MKKYLKLCIIIIAVFFSFTSLCCCSINNNSKIKYGEPYIYESKEQTIIAGNDNAEQTYETVTREVSFVFYEDGSYQNDTILYKSISNNVLLVINEYGTYIILNDGYLYFQVISRDGEIAIDNSSLYRLYIKDCNTLVADWGNKATYTISS